MKKYTSRTTNLSSENFTRIRERALAKAKTGMEKRFINSNKFKTTLNKQIRVNRTIANVRRLENIVRQVDSSSERQKILRSTLGEIRKPSGTRNSFSSQYQTKRLKNIERAVKQNPENIKRYITRTKKYKDIKEFLPEGSNLGEIINSLDRTNFYYENRRLIIQHNKNVAKHGVENAKLMKTGQNLRSKYIEALNFDDQDLIDMLLG